MEFKVRIIVTRRKAWKSFVKQHNWSGESSYRKTKLKCQKELNIITGVCHWTRASALVFQGSKTNKQILKLYR